MRNKAGILCMMIGAALIIGALSLFLYNQYEASKAEEAVDLLVPQIKNEIESVSLEQLPDDAIMKGRKMKEKLIDGYAYIGYLSIPKWNLELPVMSEWDYSRLRIAPCRYTGTVAENDLVIMAHNYERHFGNLSKLMEGDSIYFTDMNGITTLYQAEAKDVLNPEAVEEMTSGIYDLTLFTCTYGGQSRVTIYCNRMK